MNVQVVKGTVVYKSKEYPKGASFDCDKGTLESLIKANIVEIVEDEIIEDEIVEDEIVEAPKKTTKPKAKKEN